MCNHKVLISIYLQDRECLRVSHNVINAMSRSDQQTEPRSSFAHLFSKAKSTCDGHRKTTAFCVMSPISWKEQDITRMQHNFHCMSLSKLGILLEVGCDWINLASPSQNMPISVWVYSMKLIWAPKQHALCSSHLYEERVMTVKVQRRDCSSGADPKPCCGSWNNLPLTILICSIEYSVAHMLVITSRPITHG